MSSSFFFLKADKSQINQEFIDKVEADAIARKEQTYIIDRPLGDNRYTYSHEGALVVLTPRRKLSFVDFSGNSESFGNFV